MGSVETSSRMLKNAIRVLRANSAVERDVRILTRQVIVSIENRNEDRGGVISE
jgi:hypothetical protein